MTGTSKDFSASISYCLCFQSREGFLAPQALSPVMLVKGPAPLPTHSFSLMALVAFFIAPRGLALLSVSRRPRQAGGIALPSVGQARFRYLLA